MRYDARKRIHPAALAEEIDEAGLSGLPVSWGEDGVIEFGAIAPDDLSAVLTVIRDHNPDAAGLRALRRKTLDQITAARDRTLRGLTVTVNGAPFNADEASVIRMTSAVFMLERFAGDPRVPTEISWLDANNTPQDLTPAQLAEVAAAAWLAQQAVWARNHARKVAAEAAQTKEALREIEW